MFVIKIVRNVAFIAFDQLEIAIATQKIDRIIAILCSTLQNASYFCWFLLFCQF